MAGRGGEAAPVAVADDELTVSPLPVLLGRDAEMAAARRALARAAAGHGGLLLVSGESGMGRTRLCEEIRAEARAMGMIDMLGRAYPGDRDIAFAPLGDALCAERRVPNSRVWSHLQAHEDLLAAMAAAIPAGVAPAASRTVSDFELRTFVERFLDVLDEVCQDAAGLLWITEDVHWADETTHRVIDYSARRLPRMRILGLATHCAQDLGAGHPWRQSVAVLRKLDHITHLHLGPLPPAHARALAREAAGVAVDDAQLDEVVRRSLGNPALLVELARAGALHVSAARPPRMVRDVVQRRLAQLGPLPRRVISAAAVVGDDFCPQLSRLLCVPEDGDATDVEDAVDALVGFGLLHRVVAGDGERLSFAHPLFGDVAYAMLSARERRDLHAAVAQALSGAGDERPRAVAQHWERAHQRERALAVLLAAADAARCSDRIAAAADLTMLAHELVQRHAVRGAVNDDLGDRLLVELAALGRWSEALPLAQAAWRHRDAMRRPRRAALADALGRGLLYTGAITDSGELLHDELELARRDATAGMTRLVAAVAEHAAVAGYPAVEKLLDDALAAARHDADAEPAHRLADALTCVRFRAHRDREAAAAEHMLHLEFARSNGLATGEARSLLRIATMTTSSADLRRAQACADRVGSDAAPLTAICRAFVHVLEGATGLADETLSALPHDIAGHFPRLGTAVQAIRALACQQGGDLDGAARALDAARALACGGTAIADHALLSAVSGWYAWERGDHAAAAAAFCKSRHLQKAHGLAPLDLGHAPLAWHVDALLHDGRADDAARLARDIEACGPRHDRFTAASATAARFRLDPTPQSADAATDAALHAPWPLLSLTVATWRAALLGDRQPPAAARRIGRAGPVHPQRPGFAALSPRELEVADLVSTGLSNPAIARRLHVSERTVAVHVSHVLGKLGFSSRTQIARWVVENR